MHGHDSTGCPSCPRLSVPESRCGSNAWLVTLSEGTTLQEPSTPMCSQPRTTSMTAAELRAQVEALRAALQDCRNASAAWQEHCEGVEYNVNDLMARSDAIIDAAEDMSRDVCRIAHAALKAEREKSPGLVQADSVGASEGRQPESGTIQRGG